MDATRAAAKYWEAGGSAGEPTPPLPRPFVSGAAHPRAETLRIWPMAGQQTGGSRSPPPRRLPGAPSR